MKEVERKRRDDEFIREVEFSKAKLNRIAGNELLDQVNSQIHYTCNDEFLYLSLQVDKSLQEKNQER